MEDDCQIDGGFFFMRTFIDLIFSPFFSRYILLTEWGFDCFQTWCKLIPIWLHKCCKPILLFWRQICFFSISLKLNGCSGEIHRSREWECWNDLFLMLTDPNKNDIYFSMFEYSYLNSSNMKSYNYISVIHL